MRLLPIRQRPGMTAMAMTVNPDAGLSAPDTFREEGLYAFRFDLDGDAREELAFKVTFGAPSHRGSDQHAHTQNVVVRRAVGEAALKGVDGELIAAGQTGEIIAMPTGVKVFAGLAPDLFAGDAKALGAFRTAFFKEKRFDSSVFLNHQNYFARRNVTAIVLEAPASLIGRGRVGAWATCSLYGHAPEVQVSRWGVPLLTNIFMPDQELREAYNRATPTEDLDLIGARIASITEELTRLAGSTAEPRHYAERLVRRLCPSILPYELETSAGYDFLNTNGRNLSDDVMDVILTLATNTGLGDGVRPDISRMRSMFPYFGAPHAPNEQVGVVPAQTMTRA
jgi:hypothetical protein